MRRLQVRLAGLFACFVVVLWLLSGDPEVAGYQVNEQWGLIAAIFVALSTIRVGVLAVKERLRVKRLKQPAKTTRGCGYLLKG